MGGGIYLKTMRLKNCSSPLLFTFVKLICFGILYFVDLPWRKRFYGLRWSEPSFGVFIWKVTIEISSTNLSHLKDFLKNTFFFRLLVGVNIFSFHRLQLKWPDEKNGLPLLQFSSYSSFILSLKHAFLIKTAYHCKGGRKKKLIWFLVALQLAICIERKHQSIEEFQDCLESQDPESPRAEVTTLLFSYCYFNAINFLQCPSCSLLLTWKKHWNYRTGRKMVQFPRMYPLCRHLVKILMGNVTGEIRSESSSVLLNWRIDTILYHQ